MTGVSREQLLFTYDLADGKSKQYAIEEELLKFFSFPDESKAMIRRRDAGVGLYDQIAKLDQQLFVSNDARFVIFVSLLGVLYFDSAILQWKIVTHFKEAIKF